MTEQNPKNNLPEEEPILASLVEEAPEPIDSHPLILENIVFSPPVTHPKTGRIEYKSPGSPGVRKIAMLSESSPIPEPGRPYKVKVIKDTMPDKPHKGMLIVELYYETPDEKALDIISKISETQKNAKTKEDWNEIAKLYRDIEGLYEPKQEKGRQMEFESVINTKVKVTNELEKYGLKVGQKVKVKLEKKEKIIDGLKYAKDLTIVGFADDNRIVIQVDGGPATYTYENIFEDFYELVKEKPERQMEFKTIEGRDIRVSNELKKDGLKVGQKVTLKKNHLLVSKKMDDAKEFVVVGFEYDCPVIQIDGNFVIVAEPEDIYINFSI